MTVCPLMAWLSAASANPPARLSPTTIIPTIHRTRVVVMPTLLSCRRYALREDSTKAEYYRFLVAKHRLPRLSPASKATSTEDTGAKTFPTGLLWPSTTIHFVPFSLLVLPPFAPRFAEVPWSSDFASGDRSIISKGCLGRQANAGSVSAPPRGDHNP